MQTQCLERRRTRHGIVTRLTAPPVQFAVFLKALSMPPRRLGLQPGGKPRMLLVRRISFVLAAVLFLGIAASPARAVSPNIVISQVYGGAGCGTAGCSTY